MQYRTYQQIIETARREHASLVAWFDRPSFGDAPASVRGAAKARAYQLENMVVEILRAALGDDGRDEHAARWAEGTMHGARQDCCVKRPHGNHGDTINKMKLQ